MDLLLRIFEKPIDTKVGLHDLDITGRRAYRMQFSLFPATQPSREIIFDMEVDRRFFDDAPPSETQARVLEVKERALLACLKKAYPETQERADWWKFWRRPNGF